MAYEAFNYLVIKKHTRCEECVIKLEMQKAYERVGWGFLTTIMTKMGFSIRWISWIMKCVSSGENRLTLIGKISTPFKLSKRLRQGYSISRYLFVMVSNVLS